MTKIRETISVDRFMTEFERRLREDLPQEGPDGTVSRSSTVEMLTVEEAGPLLDNVVDAFERSGESRLPRQAIVESVVADVRAVATQAAGPDRVLTLAEVRSYNKIATDFLSITGRPIPPQAQPLAVAELQLQIEFEIVERSLSPVDSSSLPPEVAQAADAVGAGVPDRVYLMSFASGTPGTDAPHINDAYVLESGARVFAFTSGGDFITSGSMRDSTPATVSWNLPRFR